MVLDDPEAQLFLTTQLYEEAKHTDIFDRYWREVIHEVEDRRGVERTSPHDDGWFDDYVELFDRMGEAMHDLLVEDTSDRRAVAYCHYHLVRRGHPRPDGLLRAPDHVRGRHAGDAGP